jgi:hypothetical protein
VAGLAVLGASSLLFALVRFLGYFESAQQALRLSSRTYDQFTDELRRLLPSLIVALERCTTAEQLQRALASSLRTQEILAVRGLEGDAVRFEVSTATAVSGSDALPPDNHSERFTYASGAFTVEVLLRYRRSITPSSLALLQVAADVTYAAAERSELVSPNLLLSTP